ncbi:hypothetical protein N2152v2_009081 [Parachlorella kessleri]
MGLIEPPPVVQATEECQTPVPQRLFKRAFQTAKVYRVGGLKARAPQEWWPYGVNSPGLYLHLWGRQLARNICQASQRSATVWRPAADSLATPSSLLEKRSCAPLMVHIPATYTNISKEDTSVEYVTAVQVQRQSTTNPAQTGTPTPDPFLPWGNTQKSSTHGLCSFSSSSSSSSSDRGSSHSSPARSTRSLPAGHFIARANPQAASAHACQRAGQLRWPGRAVLQEPLAHKTEPPLHPPTPDVQPSQQQLMWASALPPRPMMADARQCCSASSSILTSPSDTDAADVCIEVIELHPVRARRSAGEAGSGAHASRGKPAEVPWLLSGLLKSARLLSPDSVLC